MSSVNKAIIIGHLGSDPKMQNTKSGGKCAFLSVATTETWKDKNTGEKRSSTEWHNVVVFVSGAADYLEKYAYKGGKVYIEGKIEKTTSTNKDGVEIVDKKIMIKGAGHRIELLSDGKKSGDDGQDYGGAGHDMDDEIPF